MVSESPWCNPAVHRRYPRWHLCNLSTSSDRWRLKVCGEALCLLGFSGKRESWLQISVPYAGNGLKQHSSPFYVILLHFEKLKAKNRAVQSSGAGRALTTTNMAAGVWASVGTNSAAHRCPPGYPSFSLALPLLVQLTATSAPQVLVLKTYSSQASISTPFWAAIASLPCLLNQVGPANLLGPPAGLGVPLTPHSSTPPFSLVLAILWLSVQVLSIHPMHSPLSLEHIQILTSCVCQL